MKLDNKLGFFTHLLPAMNEIAVALHRAEREQTEDDPWHPIFDFITLLDDIARGPTIFDCRGLPVEFLDDTGLAALEEWQALGERIVLPMPNCYFEFADRTGCLATSIIETDLGTHPEMDADEARAAAEHLKARLDAGHLDPADVTQVEVRTFPSWRGTDVGAYVKLLTPESGYFRNGYRPAGTEGAVEFFEGPQGIATRIAGVLALLQEKLIATQLVADPAARLNAKRERRGRLPVSGESHVLTINTAALRKATRGQQLHRHESPRLHWRRGHWRVLHRFSEFESKSWVRRCLVGDPARGSVHKDYRVIWAPPMLATS